MTSKIEKLISKAHYNLTRKKGRPEYAPTAHEIQKEINQILTPPGNRSENPNSSKTKN